MPRKLGFSKEKVDRFLEKYYRLDCDRSQDYSDCRFCSDFGECLSKEPQGASEKELELWRQLKKRYSFGRLLGDR